MSDKLDSWPPLSELSPIAPQVSLRGPEATRQRAPADLESLAAELFFRMKEASFVPITEVSLLGWYPAEQDSENNVATWIQRNPGHEQVRGFLCFNFTALLGFYRFCPHSMVRIANGTLIDITPTRARKRYPFIEHVGTAELFERSTHLLGLDFAPIAYSHPSIDLGRPR